MEKILKKILLIIPFLIIFLYIRPVLAEEKTNLYINVSYPRLGFNKITTTETTNQYNANIGDFYDYNLTLNTTNNGLGYYISFYDTNLNYYLFLFAETHQEDILDYSPENQYKNVFCSSIENCTRANYNQFSSSYYYFIYNNSTTLDTIKQNYNLSSKEFTTKNYNNDLYISFVARDVLYFNTFNYDIFNKKYNNSRNNFYINGVLQQNIAPEPEPEPEPEPDIPIIPPYNFNNNKYYVPNYHEGQCVEIIDKDTIRVFEDEFTSFYTDYYINSNYISRQGQVEVDYEKHCSTLDFTDIRYYGNDFPKILFILICFLTFTFGFPYVLYKRFRKK